MSCPSGILHFICHNTHLVLFSTDVTIHDMTLLAS